MIRFFSIVIVMWGLIIQPLMAAAMPAKMMADSTHSSVTVDMDIDADVSVHARHHDTTVQSSGDSSKAPCHEKTPEESSSDHCDNCGDDCTGGHCATPCGVASTGGVAVFQKLSVNLSVNHSMLVITTIKARIDGLPSRIFHPPKRS